MVRKTKKGEVKFRPGSEILSKRIIRKGKKREGTIYEVVEAPRKTRKYRITIRGSNGKLREVEMTRTQLKAYEKELERAAGMSIEVPEEIKEKERTVPPIVVAEKPGEPRLKTPTLYAVKDELERKLGKEAVAKIPYKRLVAYTRAVKKFKEDGERRRVEEREEKEETEEKKKKKAAKKMALINIGTGNSPEMMKLVLFLIGVIIVLGLIAWLASIF